jgi:hypothetical protein
MTKEEVISFFKERPYALDMGVNKLSSWLKTDVDTIRIARAIVRKNMKEFGTTYHPKEVAFNQPKQNAIKVLFLDIETAPMIAYVWGRWQQNVHLDQTFAEWYCLSWSAKWGGESEMINGVLTPEEAVNEDDSRIMIDLWNVLNQADCVVTHNGIKFDHKKINTRFILNGLPPTRPFRIIDTLKVVKENFAFSSNKLDNLLIQFGLDRKLDTNFKLWKNCMNGNPEALAKMSEYNDWDVISLEKAFARLKPWIKNFPNYVLYNDVDDANVCPTCGGKHLIEDGMYTTVNNKYVLYRCTDCGCISRNRRAEKTIVKITNNIR